MLWKNSHRFGLGGSSVLEIMRITPSPQSVDYVNNKKQFQLQSLLTEQRHPENF